MKELLKKYIPGFIFDWYHFGWALLGALIYKFPSKKIKVIGVTGTNGKSSVIALISKILQEDGFSVASMSSVEFKIKSRIWPNDLKMTMPGRTKIQSFIKKAVQSKCHYFILEVTSEGIKQYRHRFIDFNSAVFTNLTKEHIESHNGFENYKKAKGKLFKLLKKGGKSIINLDDNNADYFINFEAEEKWGYGLEKVKHGIDKLVQAKDYQFNRNGSHFKLGQIDFKLNLLGKFNLYNALAAISVCLTEGISLEEIKEGIEEVKGIPGRLEIVIKEPITVIIDYAHTPDALEKVYQTLRELFSGRLIGVLGSAGGGRDKWKRPEMGQIAEKYLDRIILTNEDPYDENPEEIINQIAKGVKEKEVEIIVDRKEAIRKALRLAQKEDIVIITGKGSEPWMVVEKGKKIPWNEREIVQEEFKKVKN